MTRQLFEYHPVLGYRFVPGLRARVDHEGGGYLLRTNGSGFRCRHEFLPRKAAGTFRVLLFGDSYTAGDGVSDRDRYGELLEGLLPGVEVYNLALPGTGTDQHYLAWREFAAGLEHDLIVIACLVENVRRVVARYRRFTTPEGEEKVLAKPFFTLQPDGGLRLENVPVPRDPLSADELPPSEADAVDRGGRLEWMRRAVNRLGPRVKDELQRLTRYQPLPEYDDPDSAPWRLMRGILLRWIGESAVPVIVMPLPLYQHVEETAPSDGYLACFRQLHDPPRVLVHDPLPDLRAVPRAERRAYRFEHDVHPTPAAHQVLARSLAGPVESLRTVRAR